MASTKTTLARLVRKLGAPAVAEALGIGTSTLWRWVKAGPPSARIADIERLARRKMRPKPPAPKKSARRQLNAVATDLGAQFVGKKLRLPTTTVIEQLARPRDLLDQATVQAIARAFRVDETEARRWFRQPDRVRSLIRQIGIKRTAIRADLPEEAIQVWLRRPASFVTWAQHQGLVRLASALDVTEARVAGWQKKPALLREFVAGLGLREIAERTGVSAATARGWAKKPKLPESARAGVQKIAAQRERGRKATEARIERERRKREQARAATEARTEKQIARIVESETRVDEHMDYSFTRPRPKSTLDPEEASPSTHPVREDKKRAYELPDLKEHQVLWPDAFKRRSPPTDSRPTQPGFTRRTGRKTHIPIDLPPFEMEWMKRRRAVFGHTFSYLDSEHFGKQIDEITPTGKESPAIRELAKMILDARDAHDRTRGAVIGVYVEAHRWIPDHAGYHVDSDLSKPVEEDYEHKILNWHVEPHGNLNIITNERELINQLTAQLSVLHEKNTTRFLVLQALRVRFYVSGRRAAA